MRLLLVEDDASLGNDIRAGLIQEGYAVDWVSDGVAAELALATGEYALLLLNLGLPKRSGLEVLRRLRAEGNDVPVLILTARGKVQDRVQGLDCGADDYLTKPFDMSELFARIRALLRRQGGCAAPVIRHNGLMVDPASHKVVVHGRSISVSPREFAVLQLLLVNRGKVLSRRRLEESLYAWNAEVESNTVEVHIHHLRRKLGAELIRTIRGVGYVIETTAENASSNIKE